MASEKRRAPALLVMDQSPDLAQHILSALRNRGVVVHTHHAESMEKLLKLLNTENAAAVLLRLNGQHPERVAQVRKLLDRFPGTPMVLLIDPIEPEGLADALPAVPEVIIDDEEADQLVVAVQRIIEQRHELADLRQGNHRLVELEERYNLLLESSREAIAYIHEGLHIYANSAYLELFGYPGFDEIEGVSLLELLQPESEDQDLRGMLKKISQGELPEDIEVFNARAANGNTFPCDVEFSESRYNNEVCTQLLVRKRALEVDPQLAIELERLKTTDLLTGMFNRQVFMQRLNETLEKQEEQKEGEQALLFIEIDRYEQVLERLGVSAVERLIAKAAKVFQSCIGEESDLSCRYGDHTFAFFISRDSREAVAETAKCCIDKLALKPLELDDASVSATCSVGYTFLASLNRNADMMVSQSISAWQEAVSQGGNTSALYKPRRGGGGSEDQVQVWAERLRHALDNEELLLTTVGITNMEDESLQMQQVMVRLKAEDSEELVNSDVFMPAAHSIGLAGEVDRFVLRRLAAMKQVSDKQRFFINISGVSLASSDFGSWLDNLMAESQGVRLKQLVMLLNPQEIATNLRPAQTFMDSLGPRGVTFGLDPFGESEDGERVVQHLPLDYVRLHPKLTAKLGDNAAQQRLGKVVAQAKQCNAQVIAPDVADATGLSSLWQHGITLVQGGFLGQEQLLA
ncbi:MAG: EAL domain-containing protein [Wenzhouxiangellaceae bacterium]